MSWSPDGKSLIFPEALDNRAKARLSILSLSDLTARPLTSPHNQQFDCDPVFSPDGTAVAFARGPMGAFLSDLFVLKIADGQVLRLTTGNSGGDAAWTEDGKEIVFDSSFEGFKVYGAFPLRGVRRSRLPVRGMPMSPRSHAGGTSSLTGWLSSGKQFGGST
jgi:Tol biopolymer transport system component